MLFQCDAHLSQRVTHSCVFIHGDSSQQHVNLSCQLLLLCMLQLLCLPLLVLSYSLYVFCLHVFVRLSGCVSPIECQFQLFRCVSELALLCQEQASITVSTIHRHATLGVSRSDAAPLRLQAAIFAGSQIGSADVSHLAVWSNQSTVNRIMQHVLQICYGDHVIPWVCVV